MVINTSGIRGLYTIDVFYSDLMDTIEKGDVAHINLNENDNPALIMAFREYNSIVLKKLLEDVIVKRNRNKPIAFVEMFSNSICGKIAIKNNFRSYNNCFCGDDADLYAIIDCLNYSLQAGQLSRKDKVLACYLEKDLKNKVEVKYQIFSVLFITYPSDLCHGKVKISNINIVRENTLGFDNSLLDRFSCVCYNPSSKEPVGIGNNKFRNQNLFLDLIEINQNQKIYGKFSCLIKRNHNLYLIEGQRE